MSNLYLSRDSTLDDRVGAHIVGVQPVELLVDLLPGCSWRAFSSIEDTRYNLIASVGAAGRKPAIMAAEITKSALAQQQFRLFKKKSFFLRKEVLFLLVLDVWHLPLILSTPYPLGAGPAPAPHTLPATWTKWETLVLANLTSPNGGVTGQCCAEKLVTSLHFLIKMILQQKVAPSWSSYLQNSLSACIQSEISWSWKGFVWQPRVR